MSAQPVSGHPATWWSRLRRLCGNRDFQSYLRDTSPVKSIPTAFALLKIAADPSKCNDCGACAKTCPMNINIPGHIHRGEEIPSEDCILCQTCIEVCPQSALTVASALNLKKEDRNA